MAICFLRLFYFWFVFFAFYRLCLQEGYLCNVRSEVIQNKKLCTVQCLKQLLVQIVSFFIIILFHFRAWYIRIRTFIQTSSTHLLFGVFSNFTALIDFIGLSIHQRWIFDFIGLLVVWSSSSSFHLLNLDFKYFQRFVFFTVSMFWKAQIIIHKQQYTHKIAMLASSRVSSLRYPLQILHFSSLLVSHAIAFAIFPPTRWFIIIPISRNENTQA